MDYKLWIMPVLKGKTDAIREYCRKLEGERRAEFATSQQRLGIAQEIFWLWQGPDGRDYIILYMSGADMTKALKDWADSELPFEAWGKGTWAEFCTEVPEPLWASGEQSPYVLEAISTYDVKYVP